MGQLMRDDDIYIGSLLDLLNLRFAPDDSINEMIALQKEFDIFSEKHSFRECVALLGLGGFWNWPTRQKWYRLLDWLKQVPSDVKTQNGNERIVAVLRAHLVSKQPLPVYFTAHDGGKTPGVRVKRNNRPLVYSLQKYLTISLPMKPRDLP